MAMSSILYTNQYGSQVRLFLVIVQKMSDKFYTRIVNAVLGAFIILIISKTFFIL